MKKFSVKKDSSLADFQEFIGIIYSLPDDRLYSLWDLLTQEQRFAMRALKGIRKHDKEKLKLNLLIALSWIMSIGNRLHVTIGDEVAKRFPGLCSYCAHKPCICKTIKPAKRKKLDASRGGQQKNIAGMQKMFAEIYPPASRTLAEAGVHLAEEVGEVSEAIHNYMGEHKEEQFEEIRLEIADFVSCVFGVANSAGINVAHELAAMYANNCHVCHHAPCACSFSDVAKTKS